MTGIEVTTSQSAPEWCIRPYRAGDEQQLPALFERTFGKRLELEDWRWKFMSSPTTGDVEHIWVAELPESGRLVGQYAGIPIRMKQAGKLISAMVSVDTITDPDFRRQGMLTRFGDIVYRSWAEAGRSLIIGLPNQQWGSRKEALGWVALFPLAWLRFPLRADLLLFRDRRLPAGIAALARLPLRAAPALWLARAERRARRASLSSLACKEYNNQDEGTFDRIWSYTSASWTNAVVRDDAYVRWRYLDAKPEPYDVIVAWRGDKPVGYVAFRAHRTQWHATGYIADLFSARNDRVAMASLATAALRRLYGRGVGLCLTLAVPGSLLYVTLRRLGYFSTSLSTAFSFEVVPLGPHAQAPAPGAIHDWHVAGGDSDVI